VPTYTYACTECDERLEVVQTFTADPLTECPRCHGLLRKVFHPVGVVFKGSGFYRTDSRSGATKQAASGSGSSDTSSEKGSGAGSTKTGDSGARAAASGATKGSDSGSGSSSGSGSGSGSRSGSGSGSSTPS
jgi:putative FmdB family regulatory protein